VAREAERNCAGAVSGDNRRAAQVVGGRLSALDMKSLSESDICDLFISPAIKGAGWDQMTQIRREVTLAPGTVGMVPCAARKAAESAITSRPRTC
jgi:hypothetical protein